MTKSITPLMEIENQKKELLKYDITKISDTMFQYKKHSFSNAKDALDHAKRMEEVGKKRPYKFRDFAANKHPVISHRVTFTHPFNVVGITGVQAPGNYSIETQEKIGTFVSNLRDQNLTTWITLHKEFGLKGVVETVEINPLDLKEAIEKDQSKITES